MLRQVSCLLALLILSCLAAPAARAVELVNGTFSGSDVVRASDAVARPLAAPVIGDPDGTVLLDFTPRGGGQPMASGEAEPPRLRFQLTIDGDQDQRLGDLGLTGSSEPSWLAEPTLPPATFTLGGALEVGGWTLGAGLARSALLGDGSDMLVASIGYGSLRASLGYGQTEGADSRPLDLMMFSTDLAALSWLALESDLALGSDRADESVAVGRFGLKLSF